MRICLLTIGKTSTGYLRDGIEEYASRISRMGQFEVRCLPDVKASRKLTIELQKNSEGELILDQFQNGDYVILLDER